jgi:hypothetical protein
MNSAGIASSLSIPLISGYGLGILRVSSDQELKTESPPTKPQTFKKNRTGVSRLILNVAGPIPSLIARRNKTFHIFTSEIEGKEKLKLENSFYINSLAVERGDKVAVNFYNLDSVRQEGHSFTIGDPYKVDIDIVFAENGDVTLTANNQTTNQYYSKKHQPLLAGQVLALPQ